MGDAFGEYYVNKIKLKKKRNKKEKKKKERKEIYSNIIIYNEK
jgi:hypothetical protein